MTNYSTGSVVEQVHKLIDGIGTGISGTNMNSIVDQQRFYVQSYTGMGVGSIFDQKFFPVLVNMTASSVLGNLETQGSDLSSFKLGDWGIKKGQGSNTSAARKYFDRLSLQYLNALGRGIDVNNVFV